MGAISQHSLHTHTQWMSSPMRLHRLRGLIHSAGSNTLSSTCMPLVIRRIQSSGTSCRNGSIEHWSTGTQPSVRHPVAVTRPCWISYLSAAWHGSGRSNRPTGIPWRSKSKAPSNGGWGRARHRRGSTGSRTIAGRTVSRCPGRNPDSSAVSCAAARGSLRAMQSAHARGKRVRKFKSVHPRKCNCRIAGGICPRF